MPVKQPPGGASRKGTPMTTHHRHAVGIVRREFLQVGFSGFFGMGVSSLLAGRAAQAGASGSVPGQVGGAPKARAKSMILVFLTGAPSHIDTFDMKPDAPEA